MEQMLKGVGFHMLLDFINGVLEPGAMEKLLPRVSQETRRFFDSPIDKGTWYPLRFHCELEQAIVDEYFHGQIAFARRMAHYTMKKAAEEIYRLAFISFKKPSDALANTPRLWKLYCYPGEGEMDIDESACTATATLTGFVDIPDLFLEHVAGWGEAMLGQFGAQGIKVTWKRKRGAIAYNFRWTEEH